MAGKFEIFWDHNHELRFRLVAPNGEIVAQSEAYSSLQNCKGGIESVRRWSAEAEIVDTRPVRTSRTPQ